MRGSLNLRSRAWLWRVAAGVVLAAGLWGWWSAGGLKAVVWEEEHLQTAGPLIGPEQWGQAFRCPEANLARVEARLGTYGAWSTACLDFSLARLGSLPDGPWGELGPGGGTRLPLKQGQSLVHALDLIRPDYTGLELLVARPPGLTRGRLVVEGFPFGPSPKRIIFREAKEVAGLPAFGWVRFDFSPAEILPDWSLKIRLSLQGAEGEPPLVLFWNRLGPARIEDKPFRVTTRYNGFSVGERSFPGELVMRLAYPRPDLKEKVLAQGRVSALAVSDNAFQPFDFGPLPDSRNQAFLFTLSAPKAGLKEALTAWTNRAYGPRGCLVVDGVPRAGSLTFRAYSAVTKREAVDLFASRMVEGRTLGPGLAWLVGAILVVQAALMAGLLIWIFNRPAGGPPGPPDAEGK